MWRILSMADRSPLACACLNCCTSIATVPAALGWEKRLATPVLIRGREEVTAVSLEEGQETTFLSAVEVTSTGG